MNQGIYFGQLVIGPAGSGKVLPIYNNSQHSVNICNRWLKHFVER